MRRLWTEKLGNPQDGLTFESRLSRLETIDGTRGSEINVHVPSSWSVLASDILAQKYLRYMNDKERENHALQVCKRMASAWSYWGWELGYFEDEESRIFEDEILFALLRQMAAPNSPQWFNTGLYHSYGIEGESLGHWYIDADGMAHPSSNTYERPQAHACFIQSVKSDLVRPGGLMDLWAREARLFKLGSGTGTNFSCVPGAGEPLPGGGLASGVMGFLKVGDASAGAIRSGGITRRAAKMVILDMDHPDILKFIAWKLEEERKVAALIAGSNYLAREIKSSFADKLSNELPAPLADELMWRKSKGESDIPLTIFDGDFNGQAYASVSGQNSNNSIRIPAAFFKALGNKESWGLNRRLDGQEVERVEAQELWQELCYAAWACADPGVQFSDTINFFHTCKEDGEIVASNPCSEYLFLDDTGCNLASINLLSHFDSDACTFDIDGFVHACSMWTRALDITVGMAQYPSRLIAERSHLYRTLGLGYANLGGLLMASGVAYDSSAGRNLAAAITSLMTATAYETSIELARKLGPFPAFTKNRKSVIEVLEYHAKLSRGEPLGFDQVDFPPLDESKIPQAFKAIAQRANQTWERVLKSVRVHGLRNAQVTAIAPTGTIGLLMDCDTTGIEPDYALIKTKKLVGGGSKTIVNRAFESGLKHLGYSTNQIEKLKQHVLAHGEIVGAPDFDSKHASVFQTSLGANSLSARAHLWMVAACGPFVSGGISKTINLPRNATPEDVSLIYLEAHRLGAKSISLYRDTSKLSQPLSAASGIFLPCPKCGKAALVPAGTCHKCENCGETTSCS